jgi:DNA-binding phage protein
MRAREWTAYRLALVTGLQQQTIRRLLAGTGTPTLDTLDAVAKAMGLKVRVLPID